MVQKNSNDFVLLAGTEKLYQTLSSSEARPTIALNTAKHLKVLVVVVVIVSNWQSTRNSRKKCPRKRAKTISLLWANVCFRKRKRTTAQLNDLQVSGGREQKQTDTEPNWIEFSGRQKRAETGGEKKRICNRGTSQFCSELDFNCHSRLLQQQVFSTFKRCCKLNYNHTKKISIFDKIYCFNVNPKRKNIEQNRWLKEREGKDKIEMHCF